MDRLITGETNIPLIADTVFSSRPAWSKQDQLSGHETEILPQFVRLITISYIPPDLRQSYLNSTDESTPRTHTESHGGLAALLLDGAGLEVEDPAVALVLAGAELLPHLLLVLGVDVVVHTRPEPVALGVVEDGCDAVRDVNNSAVLTGHNKQESVSRLQYQVLELVVCEEGRFVRPVIGRRAGDAPEGLDMRHGHPQDGQLVWLAGQRVTGWHHVGQLRDVGGHLVPSPPLNLTVVLPGVPLLVVDLLPLLHPAVLLTCRVLLVHPSLGLQHTVGCWYRHGHGYQRTMIYK